MFLSREKATHWSWLMPCNWTDWQNVSKGLKCHKMIKLVGKTNLFLLRTVRSNAISVAAHIVTINGTNFKINPFEKTTITKKTSKSQENNKIILLLHNPQSGRCVHPILHHCMICHEAAYRYEYGKLNSSM